MLHLPPEKYLINLDHDIQSINDIHSRWLCLNHVNAMKSHMMEKMLNGIRCDELSTVVVTVRAHSNKYEKDFDTIVNFLTQYFDKTAPTLSVKIASVGQNRPAKWQKISTTYGTFKGKIELKKYSKEDYDSMSMAQQQQLCMLQKKARLI